MPHQTPRATEHIAEIIALIEKLVARGLAYQTPDGSVYFSIEKYRGARLPVWAVGEAELRRDARGRARAQR